MHHSYTPTLPFCSIKLLSAYDLSTYYLPAPIICQIDKAIPALEITYCRQQSQITSILCICPNISKSFCIA